MLENINNFILIALLLGAAFFDITKKKIPNLITFPTMIIGLLLNLINGLNGIIFSLYGFSIGLIIFFIPFALGFVGAGDVKLIAAIGALKGFKFTVLSILFSSIAGIIVTIFYLIYKKKIFSYLKKYLIYILQVILNYIYFSDKNIIGNKLKKIVYCNGIKDEKLYIPYGLAIAIGTIFELSGIFNVYLLF